MSRLRDFAWRRRCTLLACVWIGVAVLAMPGVSGFAGDRAAAREKKALSGDSTLAEWRDAAPDERSRVAVALARQALKPDAPRLEVATAAMEISGCLTATASDLRFSGWKVAPTAATCLTAPEKAKP